MKITIATLLLVLGFCINAFSQESDLAKIKAMPYDTLKVASLYEAAEFHLDININPNKLYGILEVNYYLVKISLSKI